MEGPTGYEKRVRYGNMNVDILYVEKDEDLINFDTPLNEKCGLKIKNVY